MRQDHGARFSNELKRMMDAALARKHGDDFQARLLWLNTALLLEPASGVVRVGYEVGPKAFDDVFIEYDAARALQDHYGLPSFETICNANGTARRIRLYRSHRSCL